MAKIVKSPDTTFEPEILEQAIVDFAAAARKLLSGRLKMRTIAVLIRDSLGGRLGLADIQDALEAAAALEKDYLVEKVAKTLSSGAR